VADNALFEPSAGMPLAGPQNALGAAPPSMADAYEYHAQALQKWMADQRASGVAAGTIDPDSGWPTQKGVLDGVRQWGDAMIGGTSAPGFRAFHGSPHSFDRFDLGAIGTGEGAQAYGHGLYFADNEGVARSYRDNLSGGMSADNAAAYRAASDAHADASKEAEGLQDLMVYHSLNKGMPPDPGWGTLGMEHHPDVIKLFQPKLEALLEKQNAARAAMDAAQSAPRDPGHMYEVQVNADPAHFLDWDKPLSEQSPHVQQALGKVFDAEDMAGSDKGAGHRLGALGYNYFGEPGVGAKAADALKAAGIPGIRYLDGGSRADGTGTSNHVIFDANTIAILRKYGIAGLIAGGGAAAAGQTQQQ
jgi:hypothetical protein